MPKTPDTQPPAQRSVFFYVDGFNLYHRRLKQNPSLKWLNLLALAKRFFPNDRVDSVNFFTAQVDPDDETSKKRERQRLYWTALRSVGVKLFFGNYEKREMQCQVEACEMRAIYWTWKEKKTDVKLALQIVDDFLEKHPDVICVVSADTDVLPALDMVGRKALKLKQKVKIILVLPSATDDEYFSRNPLIGSLAQSASLPEEYLRDSLFPNQITSGGIVYQKPPGWS
jgi:uncharacterized LabA/DUF88 family protein